MRRAPIMLKRLLGHLWGARGRRSGAPLRVAIVTLDRPFFPSRRIRLTDPLSKCGDGIDLALAVQYVDNNFVLDGSVIEWSDLVVVQRVFPRENTAHFCDYLLASGRPVVYEIDDCLPEIPPYHDREVYRQWGPYLLGFAAKAALVTVSTERLGRYFEAHNPDTIVLPNYLNEDLWTDELLAPRAAPRDVIRLGYYGSAGHRTDLSVAAPALRRLLDEFPQLRLVFLGCAPEGFDAGERCEVHEPDFNYTNFPRRLASLELDVAIAPLLDNTFNRCRSHIKFLEYGFLGIPAVYSDLEAYSGTVRGDTGFLCGESDDAWYAALRTLVCEPELRARMGAAARREVTANWMLGPHAHQWLDAYTALAGKPAAAVTGSRV
jgi:glycosyltransferase involved in cell wall biosynthesis